MRVNSALIVLIAVVVNADAFYLPGTAPKEYEGEEIQLVVDSIATRWGRRSTTTYEHYSPNFGFCRPPEGINAQREGLGPILFGDRLYNSPFKLNLL
jgi:transmembrane 9 superfamily protein 2/4